MTQWQRWSKKGNMWRRTTVSQLGADCDDDVVYKNLPGPATPLLARLSPAHKQTIPGYSSEGDRSCHRGTNKKTHPRTQR